MGPKMDPKVAQKVSKNDPKNDPQKYKKDTNFGTQNGSQNGPKFGHHLTDVAFGHSLALPSLCLCFALVLSSFCLSVAFALLCFAYVLPSLFLFLVPFLFLFLSNGGDPLSYNFHTRADNDRKTNVKASSRVHGLTIVSVSGFVCLLLVCF